MEARTKVIRESSDEVATTPESEYLSIGLELFHSILSN